MQKGLPGTPKPRDLGQDTVRTCMMIFLQLYLLDLSHNTTIEVQVQLKRTPLSGVGARLLRIPSVTNKGPTTWASKVH